MKALLAAHLEQHVAHKRHPLVDGGAAEDIASPQGQVDVLYVLCQELEVLHATHEVQFLVYRTHADKHILRGRKYISMAKFSRQTVCSRRFGEPLMGVGTFPGS